MLIKLSKTAEVLSLTWAQDNCLSGLGAGRTGMLRFETYGSVEVPGLKNENWLPRSLV